MIPEKGTGLNKLQSTVNGKNMDTKEKEKNKCCCQHKFYWENASVNSIGKEPFTGPSEALVNTMLPPPFFCQAPSWNCKLSKPPFLANPSLYTVFHESSIKIRIFQWTPIILKVFILHPLLSLVWHMKVLL